MLFPRLPLFLLIVSYWTMASGQAPSSGAGIFGQLTLPGPNSGYGQQFGSRPLPYANTLWPFNPSPYSDNAGGGYMANQNRPYYYQPYGWQVPQQQQPQQLQLNDLIAELSVALVRSFAQMLAEREIVGPSARGGVDQQNGISGVPIRGQMRENIFGIPFAQPPQPPLYGGRTSTNFGYGVNAGVFAGTYGGSDSVSSPYGGGGALPAPYAPVNSQVGGGSYGGLSAWPYVPGRPPVPQPPANSNATKPAQPNPQQPVVLETGGGGPVVGEGSVVQIPLTENVQTGGVVEGSGGGELPVLA